MPNHNRGHKVDDVGEHWGSDTTDTLVVTNSSGDVEAVKINTEMLRHGLVPYKVHTYTIDTSDMVDSDTSEEVDISTDDDGNAFPANAIAHTALFDLNEVVAGTGITACVLKVGDAGNDDELITDTDVFTGATLGITTTNSQVLNSVEATAYSPIATLTFTDANSDAAATGEIVVHILYLDLGDLAD